MYWEAQKCLDGGGTVKTDFWHEHRRCNREKKGVHNTICTKLRK